MSRAPSYVVVVMADVSVNGFADVDDDLKFVMNNPFACVAFIFKYCSVAGFNCGRALQLWIPSYHVWRSFATPPQFLNQEPPRPQQLLLPDFLMIPHLTHTGLTVVIDVTADV